MFISEIFYSLQGEGQLAGVPSVFIRTSGCNLRCRWCDTPYASWKPEGKEMDLACILDEVRSHPARHCVITGGEPMLARGVSVLASTLRTEGFHITIETAGTIPPHDIACDLASVSPKLSNSTPQKGEISPDWIARHDTARINPTALRQWLGHCDYQFKFVVAAAGDISEIEGLLSSLEVPVPAHKVLLMPEGTDDATLLSRRETITAVCLKKGYRYCDRLHIHLFGNTKGT